MATVTKSIGTTARDYSTITLWEADLDDAAIYSASDDAVGECYNDSVFDEAVSINGGGTVGLNSITITVAIGERHDGTAGSGTVIDRGAANGGIFVASGYAASTRTLTIEWLELTDVGKGTMVSLRDSSPAGGNFIVRNNLMHGISAYDSTERRFLNLFGHSDLGDVQVLNNVCYDNVNSFSGASGSDGIRIENAAGQVLNNIVFNVRHSHASNTGTVYGIRVTDAATTEYKNNVCCDTANAGSGDHDDFSPTTPTNATAAYNASSDTTATGTGSITSITTADQFVSTVGGSEDLHLKAGSDCIDAGTDLGTTPTGVNIDINGRDRDAEADTWDIGAHELVVVGGTTGSKNPFSARSPLQGPIG